MCSRARAASPAADEGAEQDTGPSSAPNAPLMLGAGRCRICPVPTAARPLCRPSPHTPLCRSRKDAAMRARQRGTHQPARTFAAARRRWTVGGGDPSWHALNRFSGRARPLCLSAARRWVSRTTSLPLSAFPLFRPSSPLPLPFILSVPLCAPRSFLLILFFPPVFLPLSPSSICSPASPSSCLSRPGARNRTLASPTAAEPPPPPSLAKQACPRPAGSRRRRRGQRGHRPLRAHVRVRAFIRVYAVRCP